MAKENIMLPYRTSVRALCIAALLILIASCTDAPPVHPVQPPAPDTTSHDWVFSMHHLSDNRGNNIASTISALSKDFVVMSGYSMGYLAFLWNGYSLRSISLPFRNMDWDSCRVCPPTPDLFDGGIVALAFLRRDNFWIASVSQIQHTTVSKGDRDTMVYVTGGRHIPDIGATHIWASDSANVFFANYNASRVFRWHHADRSWTTYKLEYPEMYWDNKVWDLWGTSSESVFLHTNGGLRRFDGLEWRTIWNREMPSLCDSAYFGVPCSGWAASDEDSMWIAGLFIGRMRKDGSGRVTYIAKPKPRPLDEGDGGYDVRVVRGSAKNNVFFVGLNGYIAHYNGASFKLFDQFNGQGIGFTNAVVFDDEIFIIGRHPLLGGLFVHGRRR